MNYADIDALNWSRLKPIRVSPLYYRHCLEVGRPDTPALQLGRVAHAALYEPQEIDQRYVVMPNFHGGMKDHTAVEKGYAGGRESKAEWLGLQSVVKAEIVEQGVYETGLAIAHAVRTDSVAGPLLDGSYVEQVLTWTDFRTGRKCKCRVDQVNGRLGDLKTTARIEPRQFAAQVEALGYLGQLAFYTDGLTENGLVMEQSPILISVQSAPPYDVLVYEITEDQLEAGRILYRDLMDKLAACEATDTWPGIAGGQMQTLRRPGWATAVEEDFTLTMGGEPIMEF